jgi:hypothetical protein
MTKDQLSAIRARLDAATPGPWEAVTPKRYAAVRSEKAGCYVYTQGKIPADTHADTVTRQQRDAHLIANAPTDLRALLDEVERLTTLLAGTEAVLENEREYQTRLKAEVGQLANESFRRGAEAMREAAAQRCEVSPIHGEKTTTARKYADAVRALPTPEDK